MRAINENTESADVSERVTINAVPSQRTIMNTQRNPFRTSASQVDLEAKKGETQVHCGVSKTQISSSLSRQNTLSVPATAEAVLRRLESLVPDLPFPYVTDMNAGLEANFELILDALPALPCEVKQRTVKLPAPLPKLKTPRKTLVLGLEGTLVAMPVPMPGGLSERQRRCKPKVRPHLMEFLSSLSKTYEIIVRIMSDRLRFSQPLRAERRRRS
jgi:hypothetical protein